MIELQDYDGGGSLDSRPALLSEPGRAPNPAVSPGAGDLLPPSEALEQFDPTDGFAAGDDELSGALGHIRYGFRVGGVGLLIEQNTVSEVIDPQPVSSLPNTPDWLLGLINLRGNLVPVYDLVTLLGLSPGAGDKERRLLILDEGDGAVALLLEGLPEVPLLDRRLSRLPPLPELLAEHVTDAYLSQAYVWLEFNHDSFFSALAKQITA